MNRRLCILLGLFTIHSASWADLDSANDALVRGDYDTAIKEFSRLAEAGDDQAQAHLGYMYYAGQGVQQNYAEALKWNRRAAAQGNRDAQYNLAVAHAFGEGVNQDFTEAAIWYRRAARQGHILSQYSLGVSYLNGQGVPRDSEEAVRWFRKAADQHNVRAQVHLGDVYHSGEDLQRNFVAAAKWYRQAADSGDATAQYKLGLMYRSGEGVEQDQAQAERWLQLAADQEHTAAQNEMVALEQPTAAVTITDDDDLQQATAKTDVTTALMTITDDGSEQATAMADITTDSMRTVATDKQKYDGLLVILFNKIFGGEPLEEDASTIPALTDTQENIEQTPDTESVEPDEISTGTEPGQLAGIENLDEVMEPEEDFIATAAAELPQSSDANQPDNKMQSAFEDADVDAGQMAFDKGDYAEALGNFKPLAEGGNEDAQVYLGLMYYVGKGVKQDFKQAYAWYLKAAEQDHIEAQYRIGNMHLIGEGTEQDYYLAEKWYGKAAAQGHIVAEHNLRNIRKTVPKLESHTDDVSEGFETIFNDDEH